MTTTRKPTNCTDCGRPLNSKTRQTVGLGIDDLCALCYDYAADENMHEDEGHDDDHRDETCLVCRGEKPVYTARTGHTDTAPKSWSSHATCKHPKTPAARAACRKARAQG